MFLTLIKKYIKINYGGAVLNTKKTGDTEVIAENTKKRNKSRELKEHIIEKLFLIATKKIFRKKFQTIIAVQNPL